MVKGGIDQTVLYITLVWLPLPIAWNKTDTNSTRHTNMFLSCCVGLQVTSKFNHLKSSCRTSYTNMLLSCVGLCGRSFSQQQILKEHQSTQEINHSSAQNSTRETHYSKSSCYLNVPTSLKTHFLNVCLTKLYFHD